MRINWNRVLLGGLLAGLTINVLDVLAHGLLLGAGWEAGLNALGMYGRIGARALGAFGLWGFLIGICAVLLYAALRPTLGAGPRTAVVSAIGIWTTGVGLPALCLMGLHMFRHSLIGAFAGLGLVELLGGALLGAGFYRPSGIAPASATAAEGAVSGSASLRVALAAALIAGAAGFAFGGVSFAARPALATVTRLFHQHYYDAKDTTWSNTTWLGVPAQKTPQDMWVYQEIIHETRPDVLLETGTADGGSAYYFATIFDLERRGRVITVDIADSPMRPKHDRITYVLGSSTAPEIIGKVKSLISPGERVMVSLDSDHRQKHVAEELKLYSELVTPGCYLVVEDTNINGHPVAPEFGPGPMEALRDFLKLDSRYGSDHSREKFGVTFFPEGWLRRVH
jgi:cephalosporin hydroxylase